MMIAQSIAQLPICYCKSCLSCVSIGNVFKVIMLATATRDIHYCTCLGHPGQRDKDRIISRQVQQ